MSVGTVTTVLLGEKSAREAMQHLGANMALGRYKALPLAPDGLATTQNTG
jgi:hypothetical protein